VPQQRRRVFIVGVADAEDAANFAWPTPTHSLAALVHAKFIAGTQPGGDQPPSRQEQAMLRGRMQAVVACFDELPEDRARAVKGAYLMGLSYQDLAAQFDVPLNTMRTWLRRALISLRECLDR